MSLGIVNPLLCRPCFIFGVRESGEMERVVLRHPRAVDRVLTHGYACVRACMTI